MTTPDALLAAALASPDDHSLKLVWLDAYQERHGETPWIQATREFLAKCGERRKYRKIPVVAGNLDSGEWETIGEKRRALDGWREWLGEGGTWHNVAPCIQDELLDRESAGWLNLVPQLDRRCLNWNDRWRRKGATVEIEKRTLRRVDESRAERRGNISYQFEPVTFRARLTFARGFLERVEFRDWQSADAMLGAILADQPFAECGIRGQPDDVFGNAKSEFSRYLRADSCGPAWSLIEGYDRLLPADPGIDYAGDKLFLLSKGHAPARARRALSDALRKRALAGAALEAAI